MKRALFICLFYLLIIACFAQTGKIDSLKQLTQHATNEKSRLRYLLEISEEHETLPKDTLWLYALRANKLAAKVKDGASLSLSKLAQAYAYSRWNNTDSAALLIAPELLKYNVSNPTTRSVYFRLAAGKIDLMHNRSYKDMLSEIYKVLAEAEQYKDSLAIAENMNSIGALDYDMDMLARSKQWLYKALSFTINKPEFDNVKASIYLNMSDYYWWTNKEDSAMCFVDKADMLSNRSQNLYLLSVGAQKRASIYLKTGKYGIAEQSIRNSLQLIEKIEGKEPQQDKLIVLASVYEHLGQYNKAIQVLNDGLFMDSLYKKNESRAANNGQTVDLQRMFYYDELAKCYKNKGDDKNYEATLEKIIAEKDAFYKANSASSIAELETNYEFQKKEAMIAQQKLALAKQDYLLYGSILILLLSGIIFWLVFKSYRRKQTLLAAKAVAGAEEGERRRISADLHDNLGAQLSFIKRNVEFMLNKPDGFKASDEQRYLGYLNDIAKNAMIDLRETIWVLNKEEVYVQEFIDKLKYYLGQQLSTENIKWAIDDHIEVNWKLSSTEVMHLFRTVQELVSNVIRHSQAGRIIIEFKSMADHSYQLRVADDGKGFDLKTKLTGHYGLSNIRKRAKELNAELQLTSGAGSGTTAILKKHPDPVSG